MCVYNCHYTHSPVLLLLLAVAAAAAAAAVFFNGRVLKDMKSVVRGGQKRSNIGTHAL